jgi:hypothetical protein
MGHYRAPEFRLIVILLLNHKKCVLGNAKENAISFEV